MATAAAPRAPSGPIHRTSAALFRHPGAKLGLTLGIPSLWMLVVYLGALAFLFVASFWHLDTFSGLVVKEYGAGREANSEFFAKMRGVFAS